MTTASPTPLKRSIGLTQLVFYGAGTILGAGIYVLVGEVVGSSGRLSPLAFLLAGAIAAFSAYSFAMLARQLPVSAGEAAYIDAAFHRPWLSRLVGYAVIFMGITSSATIARGCYGYLSIFFTLNETIALIVFAGALTIVAILGIGLSVGVAVAATIVEIIGLLLVIASAADNLKLAATHTADYFVPTSAIEWQGVALGAYLAFYACIGFEDMVNVAEEAKRPERDIPVAIFLVVLITTVLYMLVTLAALTSLPLDILADSRAPLALVIESNGLVPVAVIGAISAVAVTNGALIQIIKSARVCYGMASRGLAPRPLAWVGQRFRTPWLATLVVGSAVATFALTLPLESLARVTSTIVLSVFTLVNLALLWINLKNRHFSLVGLGVPGLGAILCCLFITIQLLI